jgi:hypothetical protein
MSRAERLAEGDRRRVGELARRQSALFGLAGSSAVAQTEDQDPAATAAAIAASDHANVTFI